MLSGYYNIIMITFKYLLVLLLHFMYLKLTESDLQKRY